MERRGTNRPLLGRARLGLPPDWYGRAKDAVALYDQLIEAASLINNDDARGEIFMWTGRTDVPSDPAERYQRVVTDLKRAESTEPPDYSVFTEETVKDRIVQLETIDQELDKKVVFAIDKYGSLGVPDGTSSQPGRRVAASILTGSIALFGLVVLPLALGR